MDNLIDLESIPAGSVLDLADEKRLAYLSAISKLPPLTYEFAFSLRTGAYIRGIVKAKDLPLATAKLVALSILETLIGQKAGDQLPNILMERLKISLPMAQSITQEIERELLAPLSIERRSVNPSLKFGQARPATPPITKPTMAAQGVRNVVDLKQQTARAPIAPAIPPQPPRPISTPLPSRPVTAPTPPKPKPTQLPFDKDSLQKKSRLWQAK